MTRLPTFFVSHGSPMLALDAGNAGKAWAQIGQDLPRPRAVLMVSAHWHATGSAVSAVAEPETIHDFGGFPPALYALQYPAPGDPALAREVFQALTDHGFTPRTDPARGLDHGAWVPLRVMYPKADVPVVQLALDMRQGPAWHYHLGQALRSLRDSGVLIVGSGSMTHNLHDVFGPEPVSPDYVAPFQDWMHGQLDAGNLGALLDYRRHAPHAERAHPSEEHLLPLFVALGAAEGERVTRLHDEVTDRVLAMDVYRFG
ncbi:DODA-type extradiol aromatic ring-opening family dioxygenase [Chitiniphilus eburneus]|uniref:Dioxygenase n=1 Tax=Chitiniphilus eburneus TaxID=2571148 RepID=A0A4U0QC69_9NEIS|nr:class III extradiol ring-cleavage dioxygenase [Chitiniphilus eburneus]TJZ78730.1 dioxygenase [Chitiniphilus eburneus]